MKNKSRRKTSGTNWKKWELGFVSLGLHDVDWMPARFLPVAGVEGGCYGNKPPDREVMR